MKKHTPGPWDNCAIGDYADYAGNSSVIIGDDRRIAVVHNHGTGEDVANARLIAAAPEMLAACKAFIHAMDEYGHPDKTDRLIRSAIYKVEGEL